ATLRSFMNWDAIKTNPQTKKTLTHWRKLGTFRKNHPAIGAGIHKEISAQPYTFSRTYSKGAYKDQVIVGLDLPIGRKVLEVSAVFADGTRVRDAYSNQVVEVKKGQIKIKTDYDIVLLEKR
ncbi:MAG: alpha-amylase, partial [Paludibacter sp.]|nr:alpha-amylase [Paludibacter sp.]